MKGIKKEEWVELMIKYRFTALERANHANNPSEAEYWKRVAHRVDEEIKYFESKVFPYGLRLLYK